MDASTRTAIELLLEINMSDATQILTTAGLALVGFAFLGFVLQKARRAASGRV